MLVRARMAAAALAIAASMVAGAASAQSITGQPPPPPAPASAAPVPPRPVHDDTQPNDEGEVNERPRLRKRSERDGLPGWHYASQGLQFRSTNNRWFQWITLRNQFRASTPFDGTPTTPDDLPPAGEGETDVSLRRSRFKIGGYLGTPRLQNYVEVDLTNRRMYHFFVTAQVREWLQVRGGQWKVEFNRERVDSSGDQQFVDRSIVNEDFTLDGQWGVQARGRLFRRRAFDSTYFAGVFAGEGRLTANDDDVPLVTARYQWNLLRRNVGFSQGDVEYHTPGVAAVAVSVARDRGRYTRFGSSGGAQLDGFAEGQPGQYELRQSNVDGVFARKGVSTQGEFHWKEVIDHLGGPGRHLRGGYVQAGVFPVQDPDRVLTALELAVRFACVDPDRSVADDLRYEYSFGTTWYTNHHRNKVAADISWLTVGGTGRPRLRLQWDISL